MPTPMTSEDSLTLSTMPAGEHAIVHSLLGGHDFCARLANLGFTAGTQVAVVQNYGHGPVLVSVRGALVALGRGEADRVKVCALRVHPHGTDGRGPWRHFHRPRWARRHSSKP